MKQLTVFWGLGAVVAGCSLVVTGYKIHISFQPNYKHYELPDGTSTFDDGDIPGILGFLGLLILMIGIVIIGLEFYKWLFK